MIISRSYMKLSGYVGLESWDLPPDHIALGDRIYRLFDVLKTKVIYFGKTDLFAAMFVHQFNNLSGEATNVGDV